MRDLIDPASDYVFDAVGTMITKKGIVETEPKTREDWERIRIGAVTRRTSTSEKAPFSPAGAVRRARRPPASARDGREIGTRARGERLIALAGLCFVASVLWSQCSKPVAPPPQSATRLLGDMKPIVSVKELMADMIDPLADNIFDAVWWDVTAKGTVEHRPKTDDDWEKVRIGAVTIAEGIYLLKVPRLFAPAGDVNNSVGPDAPELSPTQIKAKIDKDSVLWNAKIEALRNVGLTTLEAVKRKDVDALFQAGADLDAACEECHLEYWYPGDKEMVLRERRSRVTFVRPDAFHTTTPGSKK